MTAQFVDISSFQGSIAWASYRAWSASIDGIARVAMKATEGTGFVDPLFAANKAAALSAGIDEIYYYHFSRPDLNGAVAEANFMHSTVGNVRDGDLLILDYEQNVSQATAEWAYEWLAQQESNYSGKLPGIYASSAYIAERLNDSRLSKYPLWLANWMYTPDERPPVPAPWTSYEFVQYSDKASIPGVPGLVDADIFLGSEEVTPMATTIDINTPGVSTYFKASSDDKTWQCTNGKIIGGAILDFYKSFGGSGLCGLLHLGLPLTSEVGVAGHAGITIQEFERACVRYDPSKTLDNPPGSGSVYLIHTDQDPRTIALQSQITALKTLPAAGNLATINNLVAQASTAIAVAGTAMAKIGPLSQVQ
jgi:GH25 family lysozyme M1 (1,4-beta-N-acetylmuramidase)